MSAALLRKHEKLWCNLAGIPELVEMLQSRGTGVFLVSGGFRVIIDPIADILKIPRDHVFANKILFNVRDDSPFSVVANDFHIAQNKLRSRASHRKTALMLALMRQN